MQLEAEDLKAIGEIVAERYFAAQRWDFVNIQKKIESIRRALETANEHYIKYPYLDRDWYVLNSADRNIHFCKSWSGLKRLVDFLNMYARYFDYMVRIDDQIVFCEVNHGKSELTPHRVDAIKAARDAGYSVYVFRVDIPDSVDFRTEEITGSR
jgi:hypothetical protein